jgi:hypothetical protein
MRRSRRKRRCLHRHGRVAHSQGLIANVEINASTLADWSVPQSFTFIFSARCATQGQAAISLAAANVDNQRRSRPLFLPERCRVRAGAQSQSGSSHVIKIIKRRRTTLHRVPKTCHIADVKHRPASIRAASNRLVSNLLAYARPDFAHVSSGSLSKSSDFNDSQ